MSRRTGKKRVVAAIALIVAALALAIPAMAETETQVPARVTNPGSWSNADAVMSAGGDFATHPPTGAIAAFYALKFALPPDAIILSAKIKSSGWKSGGTYGKLSFRLEPGHYLGVPSYGPDLSDTQATYTTDVPPGTVAMMTAEDLRDGVWYIRMGGAWTDGVSLHADWFTVTIEYRLPVSITGRPDKTAPVGKVYSFSPKVRGGDAPRTFSIKNNPRWLRLNAATGSLSGTPRKRDVGIYTGITITVTDSLGESASLGPFTIHVRADLDRGKTGLPDKLFTLDLPGESRPPKMPPMPKDGTSGQSGSDADGQGATAATQSGHRSVYATFAGGQTVTASWKLQGADPVFATVYPVLITNVRKGKTFYARETYGVAVLKKQLRFSRKCGCYEFALRTDNLEPGLYDIVVTYKGGREVMRIRLL